MINLSGETYYTANEVKEMFGIEKNYLSKQVQSGQLQAYKIGKGHIFLEQDLAKWVKSNKYIVPGTIVAHTETSIEPIVNVTLTNIDPKVENEAESNTEVLDEIEQKRLKETARKRLWNYKKTLDKEWLHGNIKNIVELPGEVMELSFKDKYKIKLDKNSKLVE